MTSQSDLVVALMEDGMPFDKAKAFAAKFAEEHPEPIPVAAPFPGAGVASGIAGAIPMMQGVTRKSGLPIPAIGQSQLKAMQTAELVAAGARLCPNCQQSVTDHLPGCSRGRDGTDMKAITKTPLAPVG